MGKPGINWDKIKSRTDEITARRLRDYDSLLGCHAEELPIQPRCNRKSAFILRDTTAGIALGVCNHHIGLILAEQIDEGEHMLFLIERLRP